MFYKSLCVFVCVCVCVQVLQRPTGEQKQQLVVHSKRVAACVTELIQTAEAMKGRAKHAHTHTHTHTHKNKHNHTQPHACRYTHAHTHTHIRM